MNTREHDLAILDQARSKVETEEGLKHREALLANVYEQSKDELLEKMRGELIDLMRRINERIDLLGYENTLTDKISLELYVKFDAIRKKIEEYARSPQFKRKIAETVQRSAGIKEANLFFNKQR